MFPSLDFHNNYFMTIILILWFNNKKNSNTAYCIGNSATPLSLAHFSVIASQKLYAPTRRKWPGDVTLVTITTLCQPILTKYILCNHISIKVI